MLDLDDVTLCCVDTRDPDLAIAALRRCMSGIKYADVVLFTRRALVRQPSDGIRLIETEINSISEYSTFMLRGLCSHLETSHLLVAQWDGFVIDPSRWDPAFLECDYIGAPWRDLPGEMAVGNGGFSLRSRRLLHALLDPDIRVTHPEDLSICRVNRGILQGRHGIRFASRALADHFSYERIEPPGSTFGFHGLFNFHREFRPEDLHRILESLPDHLAGGRDARDLCRTLIRLGRLDSARLLLDKRRRLGMRDQRTIRLVLEWWWSRLVRTSAR
jgi:Protein of unknown function (DUF5672)